MSEKIKDSIESIEGDGGSDFESLTKIANEFDADKARRLAESSSNAFTEKSTTKKQITIQPSAFRKAVQMMTNKLGIKKQKSEEQHSQEATPFALSEYYDEQENERKVMEEVEQIQRERRALERDMAQVRDVLDMGNAERFKKQRVQEIVERDLNSRLLTVDHLEMEVLSGNPEIAKRSISFEDTDIPVYDLKGVPFTVLSTTIDYRKANVGMGGEFVIGTETFKSVMDNPAIWAERRDEAEKSSGFGTRNSDARGDTISTSYWNSERNINSYVSGDLIYGFEHVTADSIISVSNDDGGTKNTAGRSETTLSNPDEIKQLEGAGGTWMYNEILLRRYSENGTPKKPSYIIVENSNITEASLRHAKYFNIPIVNVERSVYTEKAKQRGEELLDSISESDTYQELDEKLAELNSMSMYKGKVGTFGETGRSFSIPPLTYNASPLQERCFDVSKLELAKRLDFIKDSLEKAISEIESSTENGSTIPNNYIPSDFQYFNIELNDLSSGLIFYPGGSTKAWQSVPGNCSHIDIIFQLKGSSRKVKTNIYDGARIFKAEEALARELRTREDIENSDSSSYDILEPVVRKYFNAIMNMGS